jgi:hypothetical protein
LTTITKFKEERFPSPIPSKQLYRVLFSLRYLLFYYLLIQVYCPYATALGFERPAPHLFLTDINIHSDTKAEPLKLSSLTLYIDLWQGGKPAPGQNPPVISPSVGISRRISVRAEIQPKDPVLSNTRLAKIVPLSHLRQAKIDANEISLSTARLSGTGSLNWPHCPSEWRNIISIPAPNLPICNRRQ